MERPEVSVNLGKWTEKAIDELIAGALQIRDVSTKIAWLSEQFLGLRYRESTLVGDTDHPEVLVVNLEGVDCFTFIDYVEALRLSRSFEDFAERVKRVRYQSGVVAYIRRNHFFTDWIDSNRTYVEDVTGTVGGQAVKKTTKTLNLKEDGTLFLEGISPREREISFIPSDSMDEGVIGRLKTGDYAGVYSEKAGLDVSHVGIIIKEKGGALLRHASSLDAYRKVIDQALKAYWADKPGIVVLRPRDIVL